MEYTTFIPYWLLRPPPVAVHGGNPVKNAWRMNNEAKDKWYVIYAKSLEEKLEWMEAFKRERERVKEDEERGGWVGVGGGEVLCVGRVSCSIADSWKRVWSTVSNPDPDPNPKARLHVLLIRIPIQIWLLCKFAILKPFVEVFTGSNQTAKVLLRLVLDHTSCFLVQYSSG